MKMAIRTFAFVLVLAGLAAAAAPSNSSHAREIGGSHQSATAGMPIPGCGPGVPQCSSHPGPGDDFPPR